MWFHVFYYRDKEDVIVGQEKVGPYPALRFKGKHAFALVGMTEIRGVADHEDYEDDQKIDKVILSFDVAEIAKL